MLCDSSTKCRDYVNSPPDFEEAEGLQWYKRLMFVYFDKFISDGDVSLIDHFRW